MEDTVMPNWLRQRAFLTPDRLAFEAEEETITFAELNSQVIVLAQKLLAYGLKKNEKVALLFQNSPDFVRLYHALMYVGAVAVPLNTRLTVDEQVWQLADSGAKLLVCDPFFLSQGQLIREKCSAVLLSVEELNNLPKSPAPLSPDIRLNDPCTIIYTSGTTGHPKGVVLSYGNHWWSAVGSMLNLGMPAGDKWLSCVPLFHVSGLSILMKNVIYGMPVVLQQKFLPQAVNEAICRKGVTIVSVVTNMLMRMLDCLGNHRYPESFRCMLLGGGPAPLPILNRCREKDIPVYQTYGLTETASQIVTLPPEYMLAKLGSAGKPLFPAQIKIVDKGKELGVNQEGEIVVKGANVTSGYLNRREITEKVLHNGWFHTGDIGFLDKDGFLYVLDRRKDLIISGGENIYPAEIEAILIEHPDVEEAGVIGVKDERWGQVPFAFVKMRDNRPFSEKTVLAFCQKKLAGYKVPKKIIEIDKMPRNAAKKLLRRLLYQYLPENVHR
ncbi:o-succinylbenzoate--CoA ligase [Terrilactibacillus sp. S3-3]|nr:o-succinylbenzoate--CoA ligase [Terrilactibacillus sp. S3-3]